MNGNDYRKKIDRALLLRDDHKTAEATAILLDVYEIIPAEDVKALVAVGSLLREANEFSKALYCFDKAAGKGANIPSVSLGSFHSLWRMGRYDEAFDEIERFLRVSHSDEHLLLLADMQEAFFEEKGRNIKDPFDLIKQLRQTLSASLYTVR